MHLKLQRPAIAPFRFLGRENCALYSFIGAHAHPSKNAGATGRVSRITGHETLTRVNAEALHLSDGAEFVHRQGKRTKGIKPLS
jgi:hypothetical protein